VSVVNAGIGGNRILTPETYPPPKPFPGGPSALQRLDRDLFGLSGISAVVLLEGINDISAGASTDAIVAGMRELVSRVKAKGIRIVGATMTPSLTANGNSGTPDANQRRQAVNAFIHASGIFDAVAISTPQPSTPKQARFVSSCRTAPSAAAGDRLHPNRAGYQAMGSAVDLTLFRQLVDGR
jgi:lysophospholipase L1-like esterase